ncbi:MAG: hypothetical protein ACK5LV_08650, partial [Lachnospirales bacterium]
FIGGEIESIYIKRIEILNKAEDLYPKNYDISTLFTDYSKRKLEHDIKRGSKKTLKKLSKENMKNLK